MNEYVYSNKGFTVPKNDKTSASDVWVLKLEGTKNLVSQFIPFVKRTLLVSKNHDYIRFFEILKILESKGHLKSRKNFKRIVELAYEINQDGKQRDVPKDDILRDIDIIFDYKKRVVFDQKTINKFLIFSETLR